MQPDRDDGGVNVSQTQHSCARWYAIERRAHLRRMTGMTLVLPLTLLLLIGTSASTAADTVVVTSSRLAQSGWTLTTRKGTGDTASGEFVAGPNTAPAGQGSFHMYVGESTRDPLSKVYLGTNRFQGIRLDRITQLKVWICPESRDSRRGQPAQVEIAVAGRDSTYLVTYYPWNRPTYPYVGIGNWQEFDLLGTRSVWVWTNTSVEQNHGNWQWLLRRFPGASIVVPSSQDWPHGTISGCGLNIKIGAGKARNRTEAGASWWKESSGCHSYVDKLTVGYRDDSGNEIVTTYDFEPE